MRRSPSLGILLGAYSFLRCPTPPLYERDGDYNTPKLYVVYNLGSHYNILGLPESTRTYIQGSPSGCVRREIPGVTQVDENGHEGNTAVVTAYCLCWRKGGQISSRTGVPADCYYLL